ncbi:MAG: 16S rRNA (guanine(527)-N(7))-methyltransferase RsmG [Marinicella sp.]
MNEAKLIKLQTNRLISGMELLGLDAEKASVIMSYLQLLQKWNKAYNLTAIDQIDQMVTHHALDALSVIQHLGGCNSLIDVGTGGGIPGFIIAIMCPEKQVVLLDAVGKKARFMRQVKRELKLVNTEVVHERVENYFPDEKFDVVISRAFSELNQFLALTQHLGHDQCRYLAMKGPKEEVLDHKLPFRQVALNEISVPFIEVERKLYQFVKT